jgi:hypothetical protein
MLFYDLVCILIYLLLTIFVYKNLSQKYLTAISYANINNKHLNFVALANKASTLMWKYFLIKSYANFSMLKILIDNLKSIVKVFALDIKYFRFIVIRLFFDVYRKYLFITINYPTLLLTVWPFCFFPEAIPCPLKVPIMNLYYVPSFTPAAWIMDIVNNPFWPADHGWFPAFPAPSQSIPSVDQIACWVWHNLDFESFVYYYYNHAPAGKSIPAIIIGVLLLGVEVIRRATVVGYIGFIFFGLCYIIFEPDSSPSPASPIQAVKQFIRDVVSQKIDLSNVQGLQLPYNESMHLFYQSYLNVYQELYCFNYVAFFMLYQEKALLTLKAFHLGIFYGVQFVAFF